MPDTFRVKSDKIENLMISDNMKPLYTILEQIGDDLGFPSTRGPLLSSRYKLELFSSQRSNLRDSGFVAVDMETAFILQGVDALVIRTFSDMCNYDLSLPQNRETKMKKVKNRILPIFFRLMPTFANFLFVYSKHLHTFSYFFANITRFLEKLNLWRCLSV